MDAIINSGGRITRSLRKRLTSVDSDASNRPETPNQLSKLVSISERDKTYSSPTRSTRLTRNNSATNLATPGKTPGRRTTLASAALSAQQTPENTPTKRITRRRSVSHTEDDALPQSTIRKPQFDSLVEEKLSPSKMTENTVKDSPLKSAEHRRRSCRTRAKVKTDQLKKTEELSDVEVVVVADDNGDSSNENATSGIEYPIIKIEKTSFHLGDELTTYGKNENSNCLADNTEIDEEHLLKESEIKKEDLTNAGDSEAGSSNQNVMPFSIDASCQNTNDISNFIKTETESDDENDVNSNGNANNAGDITKDKDILETTSNDFNAKLDDNVSDEPPVKDTSQTKEKIENTSNTIDQQEVLDDSYSLNIQNSFKNKSNSRKSVTFEDNANEEIEKSVYPKTPNLPKNKNVIDGESNSSVDNSFESFEFITCDKKKQSSTDNAELNENCNNSNAAINDDKNCRSPSIVTPLRKLLNTAVNTLQNSTPIITESNMEEVNSNSTFVESEDMVSKNNDGCEDVGHTIADEEKSLSPKRASSSPLRSSSPSPSQSQSQLHFMENQESGNKSLNNISELKEANSYSLTYQKNSSMTPPKNSNSSKESFSPMQTESPMMHAKEKSKVESTGHSLQWIEPKIAGKLSDGSKFDAILNASDGNENAISNNQLSNENREIDSNEEEKNKTIADDNKESKDDYDSSDSHQNKHEFEDECEVVVNYESGDSMDSDERQAILENEILERGESIGSRTTDEASAEDEDADENDSFIVSDEESEHSLLDYSDNGLEENSESKTSPKIEQEDKELSNLNDSKTLELGESAKCAKSDEVLAAEDSNNENSVTSEQCNQTYPFDKSLHDLGPEESENSQESSENKENVTYAENYVRIQVSNSDSETEKNNFNDREENDEGDNEENNEGNNEEINKEYLRGEDSSETDVNELELYESKQISITAEDNVEHRENVNIPEFVKKNVINKHKNNRLSLSFSCFNKTDEEKSIDAPLHQSFNIEVTVKDPKAESPLSSNSMKDLHLEVEANVGISENQQENSSETEYEKQQLEKLQHLPLGNPLVRSRRQSLALPSNPDRNIFEMNKKMKRKSLGTDFKPSQSFISSLEAQKHEIRKQPSKRKRLSKSFGGVDDAEDAGIIDVDLNEDVNADLHESHKVNVDSTANDQSQDSVEVIENKKMTLKSTKIVHSSTPCREADIISDEANNTYQRIISRCDEILEKVNHAKLQSKVENKKKKVKRLRKDKLTKRQGAVTINADKEDGVRLEKEEKRKSDTVSANKGNAKMLMLNKNMKPRKEKVNPIPKRTRNGKPVNENINSKRLPSNLLKEVVKSQEKPRKAIKGILSNFIIKNEGTAAGDVVEMPSTPKKAKIAKKFILSTGVICEEPLTPKGSHGSAGIAFEERPSTPKSSGFKAQRVLSAKQNISTNQENKQAKRKRRDLEEPEYKLRKPQWSKSGTFYVENIPVVYELPTQGATKFSVCSLDGKRKIRLADGAHPLDALNFKKNALMRKDIKRVSSQELLQRKERLKY